MSVRDRKLLKRELWFVNAGILTDDKLENAKFLLETYPLTPEKVNIALFIATEYFIQYLELASINHTVLMTDAIKRQIHMMELITTIHETGNFHIASQYFNVVISVFEKFQKSTDLIERQFCTDELERIANFFEARSRYWLTSKYCVKAVQIYGKIKRSTVIYNSFLIPRDVCNTQAFFFSDQKIFDKIEYECSCKIQMQSNFADCRIGTGFILMEVIFDWYSGNFKGFLDSIGYYVKGINKTKYFLKSLRTILRTEEMYLCVLSDLPINELLVIEKDIRAGREIAPFLGPNVTSKKVHNLLLPEVEQLIKTDIDVFLRDNENLGLWLTKLQKKDFSMYVTLIRDFILNYQCYMKSIRKWNEFREIEDKKPRPRSQFNFEVSDISSIKSEEEKTSTNSSSSSSSSSSSTNHLQSEDDIKIDDMEEKKIKDNTQILFSGKTMKNKSNKKASKKIRKRFRAIKRILKDKRFSISEWNFNNAPALNNVPESLNLKIMSSNSYHSKLSTCEVKDSIINSIKLNQLFMHLYNRKLKDLSDPEKFLNHTLRVFLRCGTTLNEEDFLVASMDHNPCTVPEMMKTIYNFDLMEGRFFTKEERKKSFIEKRKFINRRMFEEGIAKRRYTQNRLLLTEPEIVPRVTKESINITSVADDTTLNEHTATINELDIQQDFVTTTGDEVNVKIPTSTGGELNVKIPADEASNSDSDSDADVDADKTGDDYDVVQPEGLEDDEIYISYKEKRKKFSSHFIGEIQEYFGEINPDILQLFSEKKLNSNPHWKEMKAHVQSIHDTLPFHYKTLVCESSKALKSQLTKDQMEFFYKSVASNIYVVFRILFPHETRFDKEYAKLLKGKCMDLDFINTIKKTKVASNPTFFSLINPNEKVIKKELNLMLCVLSYDIYLICKSRLPAMLEMFKYHKAHFLKIFDEQPNFVHLLFRALDIFQKIEEFEALSNSRLPYRSQNEIKVMLKLSLRLKRLSTLLFRTTCCIWPKEKEIHLIFVSMDIVGNRKCAEPFYREPGDRRIKRIEMKCNCIISMNEITNPVTRVQVPHVEIFYDYYLGNHFLCMDLLRNMFSESRATSTRIVNLKHMICMPYGEIWLLHDVEWLRVQ